MKNNTCRFCKYYNNEDSYTELNGYDGLCNIKEEWVFDTETCDNFINNIKE